LVKIREHMRVWKQEMREGKLQKRKRREEEKRN
jgi:hypothetical protein